MTDDQSDWRDSIDVQAILASSDVRGLIADVSGNRPGGMSGEQFLDISDKVFSAIGIGSVSTKRIAEVAQPLYARIGIKTGKEEQRGFRSLPGATIAATLCSLASRNQSLKNAAQADDGCVLTATVPSSIYAFEGDLMVTIERHAEGAMVTGAVTIPGQAFDWGRSKRVLRDLFKDIDQHLSVGA